MHALRISIAARVLLCSLVLAALASVANPALACVNRTTAPPIPITNPFVGIAPPLAGRVQTVLSVPVGAFGPSTLTTCACGLGLGQAGQTLPPGVTVDRALVTRFHRGTRHHTILTEFAPLNLSGVTSNGLNLGPGQIFPGATWFGFQGRIAPFTVPLLGPQEVLALSFVVSFPPAARDQLPNLRVQFASGEGFSDGFPNFSGPHPVTYFGGGQLPRCLPVQNTLCLDGGRFRVDLKWRDQNTGPLRPARIAGTPSDSSGLFYFLDANTFDATVKVLNSCSINDRYWVFASAATDVQYTITVTDTKANRTKRYLNPLGRPAPPILDTAAFATCP